MSLTTFVHCARVVLIVALLWPLCSRSTLLQIPDYPLFLTAAGVPPNIVLTMDDSGSMARAYTPDLCGASGFSCTLLANRFAKSSTGNPMYYNPGIVYSEPPKADGTLYSTTFTSAHINGYDPDATYGDSYYGSSNPNLSNNYRPTSERFFTPGGPNGNPYGASDHGFMANYASDVDCRSNKCQVSNGAGGWSTNGTQYCYSDDSCKTKGVPAYYYVFKSTCDPETQSQDNACYDIKIVGNQSGPADLNGDGIINGDDERQNFANWYSFYRVRTLAAISSALRSFGTISGTDSSKIPRIAWQALNSCSSTTSPLTLTNGAISDFVTTSCKGWKTNATGVSNAIKPFYDTHKSDFYSWITRLPSYSGTPLRSAMIRAGRYFETSGDNSPYDNDLSAAGGEEYSCRKNYHIIMTDGRWNSDNPTIGNQDGNAPKPYTDTMSNALADIAYYFWLTDLRTNLANNVSSSITNYSSTDPASCSPDSSTFSKPPSPTDCKQFWNARNDPANWQHLVNFNIGLGLSGFLTNSNLVYDRGATEPTYAGSYADLVSGAKTWPSTSTTASDGSANGADGNVADLWHAALNSRGKFYSADSPDDVVNAFQNILSTISSQAAAGGGARVASNFARLSEANPTAFVGRFNDDWSGSLEAFPFNADGTLGVTRYWEAGSLIPPGNGNLNSSPRKIFTYLFADTDNSIVSASPQEFIASTICSGSNLLATALNKNGSGTVDNLCSERLTWLRGYTAITNVSWNSTTSVATFTAPNHGLKMGDSVAVSGVTVTGTTPSALNKIYTIISADSNHFTVTAGNPGGSYVADENDTDRTNDDRVHYNAFRNRSSVLGDIMNSGVVYAYKEDFGYGNASKIKVEGGGDTYNSYVSSKTSRTPVVYVGANDGMLHAFNAEVCDSLTPCPDTTHPNAGKELFAYIPAGVHGNLSALSEPLYGKTHKYFVDGTSTLGDVYIGGGWKTYLVGGLRAGGKSIYVLDVSDPNNFTATNVKWEFSYSPSSSNPRHDLGLTFGQPQIAAVNATQWAAIFGNGYNSASEKAFLYIVDLSNGSLIAKVATNNDTSNGLSTPFPFDEDGDGIVDVIYAGDLQGHLWKFEKDSLGNWVLGNKGDPLFTASNDSKQVQAITTQPKVGNIGGKVMIYFGTGRYLEASDLTNGDVQTFYAILDDSENNPGTVSRSALLKQDILSSAVTVAGSSYTLRTVTNHTGLSNQGCYLDLPTPPTNMPSERIASSSLIKFFTTSGLNTRVIFTTSTPPSDPCLKSGTSWLMEVSATCGRLEGTAPLDLNKDQKFGQSDTVTIDGQTGQNVTGLKLNDTTGIVSEITWVENTSDGIAYKILPGSTGQVETIANSSDAATTSGPPKRISWEQIQ